MNSNTVLLHDYFGIRGGGEKLVLRMAELFDTPKLITGYISDESYPIEMFPGQTKSLNLPSIARKHGFRLPVLSKLFLNQRKHIASFSTRIYSGVAAPLAAPEINPFSSNIFYCHTPPRFLFDQRNHFIERLTPVNRTIAKPILRWYETEYINATKRMDVIVANSDNVRQRIEKFLRIDSTVIHPPVDTQHFNWKTQGDYYLSNARLTSLKRVDKIVQAFCAMPEKKLIVASGGEELDSLKRIATNAPNVSFEGWVSEEKMRDLIANAIATIYLPIDEDFGMSPVESMAAGKPVIGVAEGGLLETVLDGQTGLLLKPEFTPSHICEAVDFLSPQKALTMRSACEKRANLFDTNVFGQKLRALVEILEEKTNAAITRAASA